MRLINKTCVITAAAQGIGRATALSFAEQGAKVIATDINLELLEQLKSHSDNIQVEYLDTGLDDNTSYKYRIKAFSYDDVEAAPTKVVVGKTKPFMATVFTASSHHPFKIPAKYNGKFKKGNIEINIPNRISYRMMDKFTFD